MKCGEASELITALVDGELPPTEREELERHLAGCPACREARAAEEAIAARLRAAARPPLPPGFAAEVMAKVGSGPAAAGAPAGRLLPLWPLLAAGGAVAAAVVLMVMVGPGRERGALDTSVAAARPREAAKPAPVGAADAVPGPEAGPAPAPGAPPAPDSAAFGRLDEGLEKSKAGEGGAGAGGKKPPEAAKAAAATVPPAARPPAPAPAGGPRSGEGEGPGDRPAAKAPGTKGEEPVGADKEDERKAGGRRSEAEKGRAAQEEGPGSAGSAEGTPADEARGDQALPPATAEAARQETRVVLRIGAKSVSEGVQAVERALVLNRDATTRSGNWKDAGDAASAEGRRDRKDEDAFAARRSVAQSTGERVLEVRVRLADLGRLVLDLPPADYTVSGPALPPEASLVLRDHAQRIQDAGKSAGTLADGKQKAPAKEAPPPQDGPARPPPAGGGPDAGAGGVPPPQEPEPPPKPSQEQLKHLAEAPPPSREGAVKGAAPPVEVVLEIHIRADGK